MMKKCYFFHGDNGAVIVDPRRNARKSGEPEFITISRPRVSLNAAREVISVRDMDTGKYYYPEADGKRIQ